MTKELKQSIQDLYQTFAKYSLKVKIEGCPCCISDSDQSTLHSKPLEELTDEDLSRFVFKAMSTFGNVDDFKHFLPRVLELMVKKQLMVDEFIVLEKLDYGNWNKWPLEEREKIKSLLLNWWCNEVNNQAGFDLFLLIEVDKKLKDFSQIIGCWKTKVNDIGFVNLLEFIEFHYSNLVYGLEEFKNWDNNQLEEFKNWINTKAEVIEDGFFYYENTDKSLAESASNALYLLESLSKNRTTDKT